MEGIRETGEILTSIQNKIKRLAEEYSRVLEHNSRLQEEVRLMNEALESHKIKVNELESKTKLYRITKTLETKEGTADAKAKINELVREIDKCIGLLNK